MTALAAPDLRLPALTALEVVSGTVVGAGDTAPPSAAPGRPDEVLESLLLPALQRAPCFVAFSGGRDSSALLAAACSVARRHGLADPIPLTFRYANDSRTQEDEWQQLVLRHLSLTGRVVLSYTTQADALGDGAIDLLSRFGHYWPSGLHVQLPLLEVAAGGSMVTGIGGDELFSPWEHRRRHMILARRSRPRRGDLKALGATALTGGLRRRIWASRPAEHLRWLTDEGNAELAAALAAERDRFWRPTWQASAEDYLGGRPVQVAHGMTQALAADHDVHVVEPFTAAAYVRAVVASAPPEGLATRRDALARCFAGMLPDRLLDRTSKASFTEVFWGPHARSFAEAWNGEGLDHRLVDVDALRREWASERPDFRAVAPLHAAWLATCDSDHSRTDRTS